MLFNLFIGCEDLYFFDNNKGNILFVVSIKHVKVVFKFSILFFLLVSCTNDKDDSVLCTMEFRSIGLNVTNGTLTDYFTVRKLTSDTIRIETEVQGSFPSIYPVLTDSYQKLIENTQETFFFVGLIEDIKVINETFEIAADECHISLISGKTEISLD
ncbi:MAG: hypothetical protein RIM99_08115 [Cyclobacteriaceae bacterium]